MTCRPEPATTGPGRRPALRALLAVSTASAGTTGVLAALPTTTSAATTLCAAAVERHRHFRSARATSPNAKLVTHYINGARPNNQNSTVTDNGQTRNARQHGSGAGTSGSITLGRHSSRTMPTATPEVG
ncbi:MAG: hypothetical protein IRY85_05815 [Micromonosporaceae bacterium]|nr:hypothetical protein [Micromonosporaceae bacterium]